MIPRLLALLLATALALVWLLTDTHAVDAWIVGVLR